MVSEVYERLFRDLLRAARGVEGPPDLVAAVVAIEVEEERERLVAEQARLQAQIDEAQAKLAELPAAPRVRRRRG